MLNKICLLIFLNYLLIISNKIEKKKLKKEDYKILFLMTIQIN